MIEATCAACGTVNRIGEADVPVGAKFVNCSSCKSRVVLPANKTSSSTKTGPIKSVSIPAMAPKPPPTPVPVPPNKGRADTIDLADLPAPKRSSPLGAQPSKPAPASALSSGAELPAPKQPGGKAPSPSALDLDDLMPADLPAPKGKAEIGLSDLPAPKPRASALGDLPAAKTTPSALADLPAPKAKPPALADLPAPKKAGSGGLSDLPAPKPGKGKASNLLDDELDLPAPKPGGITDLPMPKPGANNDLPAPKGFFDDLPQPAKSKAGGGAGGIDLPAPKGFFDDLPHPAKGSAKTQELTPKQMGELKPKGKPAADAPKGFFDDLPQPATGGAKAQDLAPKGFFDDLPQPNKGGGSSQSQGLAPKASVGLFDDLPEPSGKGPDDISFGNDLDLSSGGASLDLDDGASPELDLGMPLGQDQQFQDLDLSEPTAKSGRSLAAQHPEEPPSPIKIKTPGKGAAAQQPIQINVPKPAGGEFKLDLAEDPHRAKVHGGEAAATATANKITPKRSQVSAEDAAVAHAKKRKRTRVVLASLVGLALLGAGGFYMYQRQVAKQEKADAIAQKLDAARKQMSAADPLHWTKAAMAAQSALELDKSHPQALGLAAEALIAGALDNGVNGDAKIKQGGALIQDALGAGRISPELDRAQVVGWIAANNVGQADRAIKKLEQLIAQKPKDGFLHLYMGWAQLAKGDATAAIKAFDQAVATAPATKLPALYGHGRAKLMLADIEGAKTAFATILETSKDHVCAQVGLAATLPNSQASQREADLLAILARPDIKEKKADPRCVVQASTLAGDVARNGGRLDQARERYRIALAASPSDPGALTGLAGVEVRDGKILQAAALITKALASDENYVPALLISAELNLRDGKVPDAEAIVAKLAARVPPLPTLQMASLHVVKGKVLELQAKDEEAVEEFVKGAKLAGDLDLVPTMAAVTKLAALTKAAPDEAKAAQYRYRADELLQALAERAQDDPQLSTTLGVAYLQAGDPTKAEKWLARSVAMRGDDSESKLQLAKALSALGRIDDAVTQLKEAMTVDPKRGDIALELATTYQDAGRDADAIAAYDKLLTGDDVPITVRSKAGRYFARKGDIDKAAKQAEPILKAEPENPAGLYLKGEGLIKAGKFQEATGALTKATDRDPDAQFLDALGRAQEGRIKDDSKFVESARFAYERASKADPKMFHPLLGQGRMLVARKSWEEATTPLNAASAIDGNNPEVFYYMGVAYFGLRNQSPAHKKNAAEWLKRAARPELPLELRADAAWRLGQLYEDINDARGMVNALVDATKLAAEQEKQTGKQVEWLTDAYARLGYGYMTLHSDCSAKRPFEQHLDRKPQGNQSRTDEISNHLGSTLKSCR